MGEVWDKSYGDNLKYAHPASVELSHLAQSHIIYIPNFFIDMYILRRNGPRAVAIAPSRTRNKVGNTDGHDLHSR
jgi:hypothetical protein